MGHSERIGKNVSFNVPGNKDQKLFEAALNILNNTKRLSANVGSLFYHEEKDVI